MSKITWDDWTTTIADPIPPPVPRPARVTGKNNVALWWFVGKGWVEDSRPGRQMLVLSTFDQDGKAFLWDPDAGVLREVDVDQVHTDDGNPVTAVADTGYFSGTNQFVRELTKLWSWLTAVTDSPPRQVSVVASTDEEAEAQAFVMNTDWDERVGMRGRRLRLILKMTTNTFFRLSQVLVRYVSGGWRPR